MYRFAISQVQELCAEKRTSMTVRYDASTFSAFGVRGDRNLRLRVEKGNDEFDRRHVRSILLSRLIAHRDILWLSVLPVLQFWRHQPLERSQHQVEH